MKEKRQVGWSGMALMLSTMSVAIAADQTVRESDGSQPASTYESRVTNSIALGKRPLRIVDAMVDSSLKKKLQSCSDGPFARSDFSIGHRGAPLKYPEHTRESYSAAATQGAGVIECDVTFTKDRELVCRHSECDLHTTTNILSIRELAAKCAEPFQPATFDAETGNLLSPATARCCTSDITVEEFKRLRGKMDSHFSGATTVEAYMYGSDGDSELAHSEGEVLTHRESIALFRKLGVRMIPELKAPHTAMPADFTQQAYARKMIEEYRAASVPAADVWPQTFSLDDVMFWLDHYPTFARNITWLDGRFEQPDFDHNSPATWKPGMQELSDTGLRIIAPPLWVLLDVRDGEIVPSAYAVHAKAAGLEIIAWTLERSGSLDSGGGWYYQSVTPLITGDGDMMPVLQVLADDVGVRGVFSDWPATVTYFANCLGLP